MNTHEHDRGQSSGGSWVGDLAVFLTALICLIAGVLMFFYGENALGMSDYDRKYALVVLVPAGLMFVAATAFRLGGRVRNALRTRKL